MDMKISGEKVRLAREALGMNQTELAERVGMKQQSIVSIEAGDVKRPRKLREIARALQKTEDDLLDPEEGESAQTAGAATTIDGLQQCADLTGSKITEARSEWGKPVNYYRARTMFFEGRIIFDSKPGTISAPGKLNDEPSVYAADVPDDSMSERYEPGEIVWAAPRMVPIPNKFVILQYRPTELGKPPEGVIRKYIGRTETHIIVERLNPRKRYEVALDELISIDYIAHSGDR